MKKLLSTILVSTMLLSTLSMTAMAQETKETPQQIQTATLASSFNESTGIYSFYNDKNFEEDYDRYYEEYTEYCAEDEDFDLIYPNLDDYLLEVMSNYYLSVSIPYDLQDQVQSVVIEDGVVGISGHLPKGYTSIYIPKSLKYVQHFCFGTLAFQRNPSYSGATEEFWDWIPEGEDYLAYIDSLNNALKVDSGYYHDNSSLTTVYYEGSEADRANMVVSGGYTGSNYPFMNATWVYNSTGIGTGTTATETPTPEATFPDWATSYIDFVADDIMPDISPENFGFASNRGLIAQSLFRMCGDGGTYTSNFTDAGANASAIGWCYENGVMSGNSDTWFNAEGNVTREQFALILRQLATVQGFDTSYDIGILSEYPDGTSGSDWALSGLAWAVKNGLMSGNTNGTLNPSGDVSRVEVAVMLSNFVNL